MTPASAALAALLIQQGLFAIGWALLGAIRMARRATWLWAGGVAIVSLGLGLVVLRDVTPSWMGYWVSVSVLLGGFLVMLRGIHIFCRRPPMRHGAALWLLLCAAMALGDHLLPRWGYVAVSSLALAAIVLASAFTVRVHLAAEFGVVVARACATPFALIGSLLVLRALAAPLAPEWVGGSLHSDGQGNLGVSLGFVGAGLVLNLGLVGLVCGRMLRRLQRASDHDVLTGLLNRRGIERRLHQQAALGLRHGRPLSLLSIDADHFKRINDQHGHPAGDAVLRALGQTLRGVIRDSDLAARAGGEEFWVLLPDTDAAGATELAERVLRAVRGLRIPLPGERTLTLTVSIGVATAQGPSEPVESLMRRLDAALYRAKGAGRDRLAA